MEPEGEQQRRREKTSTLRPVGRPRLRVVPAAPIAKIKVRPPSRQVLPALIVHKDDPICSAQLTTPRRNKRRIRRILPFHTAKKTKFLHVNQRFSLSATPCESLLDTFLSYQPTRREPICDDGESSESTTSHISEPDPPNPPHQSTVGKGASLSEELGPLEYSRKLDKNRHVNSECNSCTKAPVRETLFLGQSSLGCADRTCIERPSHIPTNIILNGQRHAVGIPRCSVENRQIASPFVDISQQNGSPSPIRYSNSPTMPSKTKEIVVRKILSCSPGIKVGNVLQPLESPTNSEASRSQSINSHRDESSPNDEVSKNPSKHTLNSNKVHLKTSTEALRSAQGSYKIRNETPPHFSLAAPSEELKHSSSIPGVFAAYPTLEVPTCEGNLLSSEECLNILDSCNFSQRRNEIITDPQQSEGKQTFGNSCSLSHDSPSLSFKCAQSQRYVPECISDKGKHTCTKDLISQDAFEQKVNKEPSSHPLLPKYPELCQNNETRADSGIEDTPALQVRPFAGVDSTHSVDVNGITPVCSLHRSESSLPATPFARSQLDYEAGITLSNPMQNRVCHDQSSIAVTQAHSASILQSFPQSASIAPLSGSTKDRETLAVTPAQASLICFQDTSTGRSKRSENLQDANDILMPETPASTELRSIKRRISWSTRRDSFPICAQIPPGVILAPICSPHDPRSKADLGSSITKTAIVTGNLSISIERERTNLFSTLPTPTSLRRPNPSTTSSPLNQDDDVIIPATNMSTNQTPDTPCAAALRMIQMRAERSAVQQSPDSSYEPSPDPACAAALRIVQLRAKRNAAEEIPDSSYEPSPDPVCAAALRHVRARATKTKARHNDVSDASTEPPEETGQEFSFTSFQCEQAAPVRFRSDVPSGLLVSDSDGEAGANM